jgi:hypothetical protein
LSLRNLTGVQLSNPVSQTSWLWSTAERSGKSRLLCRWSTCCRTAQRTQSKPKPAITEAMLPLAASIWVAQ